MKKGISITVLAVLCAGVVGWAALAWAQPTLTETPADDMSARAQTPLRGPAPVPVTAQAPAPVQIPPLPSAPATVPPAPPPPPVPIAEKPSGAPLPGIGPLPTIINLDSPPAPVVPSATPPVLVNPGTIPVRGATALPLPALDAESGPTVTNDKATGRQE